MQTRGSHICTSDRAEGGASARAPWTIGRVPCRVVRSMWRSINRFGIQSPLSGPSGQFRCSVLRDYALNPIDQAAARRKQRSRQTQEAGSGIARTTVQRKSAKDRDDARWRRSAADAATPISSPSGKAAGTPSAPPSESAPPSVHPRSMRSATLFGRAKTGPQATQQRSMSPTKAAPKVEIWSVTGPDRANGDMGSQRFVSAARTPNPQRDQFRLTGSPP